MKNFQYTNKDYVPSVDLSTLNKSFNTLEKGHQQAIKTASELRVEISKLDMNPVEDSFKQQLANEISQTVEDNTLFGNSYGALDDLIMRTGNIVTDGRIIGRVRNNMAKKEYDAKVDAMNLPEGMKQMYKEQNPYYYKDGEVDSKTGKTLPGELWEPTTRPTIVIPQSKIQKQALSIAAQESGSSTAVFFLTADGRPTSDPMKSETGEIFKQVGTSWVRLPADKIAKAYKLSIQSIPGAADSVKQDFNYDQYILEKETKKSKDSLPIIDGITDKNGRPYDYNEWLTNRINTFANLAKINNVNTTVNYGTALQTYNAKKTAAQSRGNGSGGTAGTNDINDDNGLGVQTVAIGETENNSFANNLKNKDEANNTVLSILKKYHNFSDDSVSDLIARYKNETKSDVYGPGLAANYYIQKYGKNMTSEEKAALRIGFLAYVNSNNNYRKQINAAKSDEDKANLLFSVDVAKDEYGASNEYSKSIRKSLNSAFAKGRWIEAEMGINVAQKLYAIYGKSRTQLQEEGFDIKTNADGNIVFKFDIKSSGKYPRFVSYFEEAYDKSRSDLGAWAKKFFKGKISSDNGIIRYYNPDGTVYERDRDINTPIGRDFNRYMEDVKETEKKVGVTKGYVTYHGTSANTFSEIQLQERANVEGWSDDKLNSEIKRVRTNVDNQFASGLFDAGFIKEVDSNGFIQKNIEYAQDARNLIKSMYSSHPNEIKRTANISRSITGEPQNYTLTFVVPKGLEFGKYKEGTLCTFIVGGGVINEPINYNPSYNSSNIATNKLATSEATQTGAEAIGYNAFLGNTDLELNKDGSYNTALMGHVRKLNVNEAHTYLLYMNRLEQIKANYQAGEYNDSMEHIEQLKNNLEYIAAELSSVSNTDPTSLFESIIDYVRYPD